MSLNENKDSMNNFYIFLETIFCECICSFYDEVFTSVTAMQMKSIDMINIEGSDDRKVGRNMRKNPVNQ
jgi:hypothetical protein